MIWLAVGTVVTDRKSRVILVKYAGRKTVGWF
jgi:hypothetical protein